MEAREIGPQVKMITTVTAKIYNKFSRESPYILNTFPKMTLANRVSRE